MKRICILSDTHGLLREEIIPELESADIIIHAGDIDTPAIYEQLASYGKLYIVKGNNDLALGDTLPTSASFTIDGIRFFLVHQEREIPFDLSNIDIAIFGHSHQYYSCVEDGVLFLNPGSCGRRRFNLELSFCRMEIENGTYRFEKVLLK